MCNCFSLSTVRTRVGLWSGFLEPCRRCELDEEDRWWPTDEEDDELCDWPRSEGGGGGKGGGGPVCDPAPLWVGVRLVCAPGIEGWVSRCMPDTIEKQNRKIWWTWSTQNLELIIAQVNLPDIIERCEGAPAPPLGEMLLLFMCPLRSPPGPGMTPAGWRGMAGFIADGKGVTLPLLVLRTPKLRRALPLSFKQSGVTGVSGVSDEEEMEELDEFEHESTLFSRPSWSAWSSK